MRDFTSELLRREIPRLLHLGHTGGPRLSRPGPVPGPAWTPRAEGGAGTSRADAPRIDPAELFRREIPRPLHPRPHGRAALVAAGPCAGPAWTSRAEGGAGTSRADAPCIAPAELFRREIPRPLHPRPHGRAALVAAGPCTALDQHPTHGQIHSLPPTSPRAKSPSRPRRVASERASHVGWPWRTMAPTLVGARVPRARRHPTPTRGSVVGRPAASAPGAGRRGRRPLPLSHPHPLGPYHSPTRTHLAPTILPPAPTSAPTILPPAPTSAPTIVPPAPTSAPTILPPAPT